MENSGNVPSYIVSSTECTRFKFKAQTINT